MQAFVSLPNSWSKAYFLPDPSYLTADKGGSELNQTFTLTLCEQILMALSSLFKQLHVKWLLNPLLEDPLSASLLYQPLLVAPYNVTIPPQRLVY